MKKPARQGLKNTAKGALLALFFVATLSAQPRPAAAQCEIFAVPLAAAGLMAVGDRLFLQALQEGVKAGWEQIFKTMKSNLEDNLAELERSIIGCHNSDCGTESDGRLDVLWKDWEEALKLMTQQMSASMKDETRQISTAMDAQQMTRTARRLQKQELEARIEIAPSDESCRFDTAALALRDTANISKAMSNALVTDFNRLGNNTQGTPAARGPAAVTKQRFNTHAGTFCDPAANGGRAGCDMAALNNLSNPEKYKNANITPSKTLFGRYTLDMKDTTIGTAVNDLIFNITGYKIPENIPDDVINKSEGKDQRRVNREYLAQMDTIVGLPGMIVAERAPGASAPDIKALRVKMGDPNADDNPSEREIRQAKIEELWSPKYYAALGSNQTEITRKELYLKALNLAQLYRLIEKTEKISTVYALETGNLVDKYDTSRGDTIKFRESRKSN